MEKLTAVGFLIDNFDLLEVLPKNSEERKQIISEAKAIEKQQIVDAGNTCVNKWIKGDINLGVGVGEQYFESTFKTKEQ